MSKILVKLQDASSIMSGYLVDNTDEVFEEIPEIDTARSLIDEAAEELEAVLKKVRSLQVEIDVMRSFSSEERFRGFETYDIHDSEAEIEWPNLDICSKALHETLKTEDNHNAT